MYTNTVLLGRKVWEYHSLTQCYGIISGDRHGGSMRYGNITSTPPRTFSSEHFSSGKRTPRHVLLTCHRLTPHRRPSRRAQRDGFLLVSRHAPPCPRTLLVVLLFAGTRPRRHIIPLPHNTPIFCTTNIIHKYL